MRAFTTSLFIILLGFTNLSVAQTDYLPVQDGTKWGYIKLSGEMAIRPQFDVAYPFIKGAAKVQKDGKDYLIDKSGSRISPVGIDDFRHIANRIIFTQGNYVGMCNFQGKVIAEPMYNSMEATAVSGIFKVGYGNYFGLIDSTGTTVVTNTFSNITFISDVFWCQHEDLESFSFYLPKESHFIDGNYKDYRSIGGRHFLLEKKRWRIENNQDSALSEGWSDITQVNDNYLIGINKKDTCLYRLQGLIEIANNFGFVESYDSNRLVLNQQSVRTLVVGSKIIDKQYSYISLLPNNRYYVIDGSYVNYLNSDLEPNFPWKYSGIEPVDSNYAKVYCESGVGVISLKTNSEIVATKFRSLKIFNNRVKAYTSNSLWLFNLSNGEASDSLEFKNFSTVRTVGLSVSRTADISNANDSGIVRIGRWFIQDKRWGYLGGDGEVVIKPIFASYSQIPNSRFTIVESRSYNARTGAIMAVRFGIVDEVKGELLVFPNCSYIDRSMLADPTFSVVRIRSKYGAFDLIDKSTGKSKRRNSAFIDSYVNGRARIYIGGKLSYTEPPETPCIGNAVGFTEKYGYSLGTGLLRMQRYIQSRYRSNVLNVYAIEGQWNYVDKNGNLLLPVYKNHIFKLTYATSYDPNNAIVFRKDSCAMINLFGKYLTAFEYKSIQKVSDSANSYYKVTRTSSSYNYYNAAGQKIGNVFEYGSDLNDGAAWVLVNNNFQILRDNGTVQEINKDAIPYRNKFNAGLSPVEINRKWTVIDTNGNHLYRLRKEKIIWSSEGYSARRTSHMNKNGKRKRGYSVIDRNGDPISEELYSRIKPFQNGHAYVRFANGKTGFINTKGEVILKGNYSKQWGFDSDGLCVVRRNGKGVVSTSGEHIVPTRFSKVFIGDSSIIAGVGKRVVVYDRSGKKLATHRQVQRFGAYENGMAMINRRRKTGYIDNNGKWSIKPNYTMGSNFSENVALVRKGNMQCIINKNENVLSTYPIRERMLFSEGILVRYSLLGYQYYNKYGKVISKDFYELARPFKNGFALVLKNGKWGVINTNGDEVLGCEYASIRINESGEITAKKYLTYGLIDQDGKEIVTPTYDNIIYQPEKQLYTLRYGITPSYLTKSGDWLWDRNRLELK